MIVMSNKGGTTMNQKKIAQLLKGFSLLTALVGGVFFFWYIPLFIKEAASVNELEWLRWPGTFGIWIVALLCYVALYYFWKICVQIGKENSFCNENVYSMKVIGFLAICASLTILFGDIILAILKLLNGAMILLSFFVIFVGCGIAVICFSLSQLIGNATRIKEENDLTV